MKKLVENCTIDDKNILVGRSFIDIRERNHSIGNDHGIDIRNHLLHSTDKVLFQSKFRVKFIKLGDTNSSSLADIGILVLYSSNNEDQIQVILLSHQIYLLTLRHFLNGSVK